MGFLDHSTNNIIVDAVLTDIGRQALSRNDGSFSIFQFALGDDEVDYDIINQYGKTVGKEKIEKNTPIFEALTNSQIALKHKIKSLPNSFLTHMPLLTLSTAGKDNEDSLNFDLSNPVVKGLAVTITSNALGNIIPPDLIDTNLIVEVDNLFLDVRNGSLINRTASNTSIYRVNAKVIDQTTITQTLSLKTQGIDSNTFDVYSSTSGYIRTFIKVTGETSGVSNIFEARIRKTSN